MRVDEFCSLRTSDRTGLAKAASAFHDSLRGIRILVLVSCRTNPGVIAVLLLVRQIQMLKRGIEGMQCTSRNSLHGGLKYYDATAAEGSRCEAVVVLTNQSLQQWLVYIYPGAKWPSASRELTTIMSSPLR